VLGRRLLTITVADQTRIDWRAAAVRSAEVVSMAA
jgi:hypothetical protein